MSLINGSAALSMFGGGVDLSGNSSYTSGVALYKTALQDTDAEAKQGLKDASVASEVKYFKDKVATLKKPDDLFKNPRLVNFVMQATGLGDQQGAEGILKKALTQNPDDKDSLVNKLSNKGWLQAAKLLKMDSTGVTTLQSSTTIDQLTKQYSSAAYELNLGNKNPAVPQAMYFKAHAAQVTSAYNILGDATLRSVVLTGLGLPKTIANQTVETQARAVTSRLNLKDLQDPKKVDQFIQKFLVKSDMQNASGNAAPNSFLVNLFA